MGLLVPRLIAVVQCATATGICSYLEGSCSHLAKSKESNRSTYPPSTTCIPMIFQVHPHPSIECIYVNL